MSIKLVTADGGTVTAELDSRLYNGLALHSSTMKYADFILSGGTYVYNEPTLTIGQTTAVGCGRLFEIPDLERVKVPDAPASGTALYTVVFRLQPSADEADERIQTLLIASGSAIYSDDISSGQGIYDVQFASVAISSNGDINIVQLLNKSPVYVGNIIGDEKSVAGESVKIPTVIAVINYIAKLLKNYITEIPVATAKVLGGIKLSSQFALNADNQLVESSAKELSDNMKRLQSLIQFTTAYKHPEDDNIDEVGDYRFEIYTTNADVNSELWKALGSNCSFAHVFSSRELTEDKSAIVSALQLAFAGDDTTSNPVYRIYNTENRSEWVKIGADVNISTAEDYAVDNPYSTDDAKQNLKDALADSFAFDAAQTANMPKILTDSSLSFKDGTGKLIYERYEVIDMSDDTIEYVVIPCEEGDTVSVLLMGETNYSKSTLHPLYAVRYDAEYKLTELVDEIKWTSAVKYTSALTETETNAGYAALTAARINVPASGEVDLPYNGIAFPIKGTAPTGEAFDFTDTAYFAIGDIYAVQNNTVYALYNSETALGAQNTYVIKDAVARNITDHFTIDADGNLLFDGKTVKLE